MVKGAIGICVVVGLLSLVFGLVATSGALDGMGAGVKALGWLSLLEGGLYLGLAVGIWRRIPACALAAAGLYTLSSITVVISFGPPAVPLRLLFAWVLWKGAFELLGTAPARPRRVETDVMDPGEVGLPRRRAAAPPWGTRSRSRRHSSRRLRAAARADAGPTEAISFSSGRPVRRRAAARGSVCPNCRDTYPLTQDRCRICKVDLVVV